MIITYFGHEYFKVQFGDTVLAFNPISKKSDLKSSRFGADVCLISAREDDMNGSDQVTFGEKEPFVIQGPGEYEVGGVLVKGFLSPGETKHKKLNTIYTVSLEGMSICFLGALQTKDIGAETKSVLSDVDILFVPIGGGDVLMASEAYGLAVSLGARMIIPMHYDNGKDGEKALDAFLKEAGKTGLQAIDKLTLKKKDLDGKEGEVVVLVSSNA